MLHKPNSKKFDFTMRKSKPLEERNAKKQEILEAARDACARLGGAAMIDDRYVVVDTTMYTVTPSPEPQVIKYAPGQHGAAADDVPYSELDTGILND